MRSDRLLQFTHAGLRYDFIDYIIVLVGSEKKTFVVHKNIVCQSSRFFRAATTGQWKKATKKTVPLPDIKPEIFGAYVGWLYTGDIDVKASPDIKYNASMDWPTLAEIQLKLTGAFCLGDYLQDSKFRNSVVDEFKAVVEGGKKVLTPNTKQYLWNHVNQDSQLMDMIVDYHITGLKPDKFDEGVDEYPYDFIVKIAQRAIRHRRVDVDKRMPENRPRCYYHDHIDETDKYM